MYFSTQIGLFLFESCWIGEKFLVSSRHEIKKLSFSDIFLIFIRFELANIQFSHLAMDKTRIEVALFESGVPRN